MEWNDEYSRWGKHTQIREENYWNSAKSEQKKQKPTMKATKNTMTRCNVIHLSWKKKWTENVKSTRARVFAANTREPERSEQRRSKYFVPFYQRQWNVMLSVCARPSACIFCLRCLYRQPVRLNVSARCFMNNIDFESAVFMIFVCTTISPAMLRCIGVAIVYFSCVALM